MLAHPPSPDLPAIGAASSPLRVGVAMCSYNGQAYIEAQIDSVMRQTRPVDLIIVSDDGSTDATVARAEMALGAGSVPWRLLRDGRLGITKNFARAVTACEADVIFLCDQDDVWRHDKVAQLMQVFEQDPSALLVFSDALLVDASLESLGHSQFQMVRMSRDLLSALEGPESFATLLRRNVVTGATVAFRRDLLTDALPFVDGWMHDEWLAILAAARHGLRCVPEPLVMYRQHGRNQCGMRPEGLATQLVQASQQQAQSVGPKRMAALLNRLTDRQRQRDWVQPAQLQHVEACQKFELWRAGLPPSRWQRGAYIAARWARGAYGRYADGLRTAVKDLLAVRH